MCFFLFVFFFFFFLVFLFCLFYHSIPFARMYTSYFYMRLCFVRVYVCVYYILYERVRVYVFACMPAVYWLYGSIYAFNRLFFLNIPPYVVCYYRVPPCKAIVLAFLSAYKRSIILFFFFCFNAGQVALSVTRGNSAGCLSELVPLRV